jgi:tRNA G46 methylase TrmB
MDDTRILHAHMITDHETLHFTILKKVDEENFNFFFKIARFTCEYTDNITAEVKKKKRHDKKNVKYYMYLFV